MTRMDLTEFIAARLDEEEAAARGLAGTTWTATRLGDHDYEIRVIPEPIIHATAPTAGIADVQREDVAEWIAAHHPRRALREVAAKRATLAAHPRVETMFAECGTCHESEEGRAATVPVQYPCGTVRHLAAAWSDHPDYRQEWAPEP